MCQSINDIALTLSVWALGYLVGAVLTSWLALPLFSRWRQAGRAGYGFEHKGVKRLKTAWALWAEYDANVLD